MSLESGRLLSHYRLVGRIGEGGMGVVWRATDTTLGRDVAIKVLPDTFAHDPERMARFEREARTLAILNHPRIASIFGVGSAEGMRFLVMELVDGEDLSQRVARGPIAVAEAVEIAYQIAEALEAAHEKGIVHRDLKPANVKLTGAGQVKVLDFGLAKALDPESAAVSGSLLTQSPTLTGPMTGANVILGTAAYMSPEQARGKSVDRRADIWAFGCVVYECLVGRRAFAGETVSDTLAKILEREPDFSALPGGTPWRVRELLERCLAKDAKMRLRDIGDARVALGEVLATRTASGRLAIDESRARAGPGRRGLVIGAAVALGVAAGAALWALWGPARTGSGAGAPICVSVAMPAGVDVARAELTPDGRTILVLGTPAKDSGSRAAGDATSEAEAAPRIYARPLDGFEFRELPGTEGARGMGADRNSQKVYFIAPIAPGAAQGRLASMPLDGSAPPTTVMDWNDSWSGAVELDAGGFLTRQGLTNLVRCSPTGGTESAIPMDAGLPGVSRYELSGRMLPGDRGVFVNVVVYDARGWHFSVGVLDPKTGKVRVIEPDGGNAMLAPGGELVFCRGNAVYAARFDLGRLEPRGPAIAVWSGLRAQISVSPSRFALTQDGSLFYEPGEIDRGNRFAILDANGKLGPPTEERFVVFYPPQFSPDGRRFAQAVTNTRGIDEVWYFDYPRLTRTRIVSDPNADCDRPVWSPDGRQLAYVRTGRDERDGVYVQNADGGPATRVLKPESSAIVYQPCAWLHNGLGLVLERVGMGHSRLVRLSMGGGESDSSRITPLLPGTFNQSDLRVSPDGRLIAYVSDESGTQRAAVAEIRADGTVGRAVEVHGLSSVLAFWSWDGKSLYVVNADRRLLRRVRVTASPELALSAPVDQFDGAALGLLGCVPGPDGRFLAALQSESQAEITSYDLVLGWSRILAQKLNAAR